MTWRRKTVKVGVSGEILEKYCVPPSEEKRINIYFIHILIRHCYLPYCICLRLRHPYIKENGTINHVLVCGRPYGISCILAVFRKPKKIFQWIS